MDIKSNINQLQKRLLDRLNVRKGSTLFTIIQEISRQAFAKASFTVSQKNSTLAKKCGVTASTISRNLKKLKDKCADLITIEQNRNTEEKFAALVFTFVPQSDCDTLSQLNQEMSNDLSNGQQTEPVKDFNKPDEVAENPTSLTTESHVLIKNHKKYINTSIVNNTVDKEKIIFDTYLEFKQQGINKTLFKRVLKEVENKQGIVNFKAYLRSCLKTVLFRVQVKQGLIDPMKKMKERMINSAIPWYDWLNA
ncbi:helix-turn-helix transcriptional regulator [Metabacillus halosaccharovorans]|nr:hypothetical protein [Metabacillus halosaccharovorans]MBU7593563.1 helix-turn-helix transcriptional regulator [Metabacillus halosaccharovorans]